jgi:hypothetical protein
MFKPKNGQLTFTNRLHFWCLFKFRQIQDQNDVDITKKGQHGLKRNRSTLTLSAELLSMISRSLDNDNFVLVSSLDLSSAFDVVNTDLLIKRLVILGLPDDVISQIKVWLKNRSYYFSLGLHLGTGSICNVRVPSIQHSAYAHLCWWHLQCRIRYK